MEQTKKILKDCEVEVCSEEEGFVGAWFRAILEENPTNSGRKKLRVRYITLLDEDGTSPLIETIEKSFIRPVPPENLYDGVELEEGSVVDADHKDGWWTGVVIKKMEDENYLAYFDSPPDILQFKRKQLRAHLKWTGLIWVRPDIKELDKSMFSSGTMVEVKSVKDKVEVAWFPAMIIKEIEVDKKKKFIVKDWNKYLSSNGDDVRPNVTIDYRRVRPTPPPSTIEEYTLLERVEGFRGLGWHQGLVRGVLPENRYMVNLEPTKEEVIFKHSDLRPFMVWEDGTWHSGAKPNPVKETPSSATKKKQMRCSSGANPRTPNRATKHMRSPLNPEEIGKTLTKAETVAVTGELGKKRAYAVMNDKTPPVITSQVTSIEKEAASPVTPSSVIPTTPVKQIEAETEGQKSPKKTLEPKKNQNGLENSSTRQELPEEENSGDKSSKRKREQKHNSDLNETDETCNGSTAEINVASNRSCVDDVDDQPLSAWINISTEIPSDQRPNVVNNSAADVEETQAKRTLTNFPFEKVMPFWKILETEEVYKTVPQNPHFNPLFEVNEDIREWSAVGMLVSFYGLLKEVKDLQLDVSSSKIRSLSSSFAKLEKHGFDVAAPQSRINKVLSLQDYHARKAEERKSLDKKIEAEEIESHKFKEEMVELESKILELKRQEVVAKEKTEAAAKKIVEMKSGAETIDQEIEDLKLEFLTSMFAP